ncbi:type II toxin-antitoxin system YafQ family toxin [Candidatus Pacebacteria bacterium]|nr:type II toxin-antitoxin system YafQ family toxin [Candidatus Paceibacterota bacterium]
MRIDYHKKFKKALQKQPSKIQGKFFNVLDIFVKDQYHHSLHNHSLSGKYIGIHSFNITPDVRVHYRIENEGVILLNIGTHSQLY